MLLRVSLIVLAALLAVAPSAARAQAPAPSVASAYGTVTPSYTAGYVSALDGNGPTLIIDGFGLNPPTLRVDPGATVTITLGTAAETFTAYLDGAAAPATGSGLVYSVTLPAVLPARLSFRAERTSDTQRFSDGWTLNLSDEPTAVPTPVPTAVPTPTPVDAPASPSSLRLIGRRLSVRVACPSAAVAACSGTLTLATPSLRIARLTFAGLAPGTAATLRATISSAAQRHLRRHHYARLRAGMTPKDGKPRGYTLPLAS